MLECCCIVVAIMNKPMQYLFFSFTLSLMLCVTTLKEVGVS